MAVPEKKKKKKNQHHLTMVHKSHKDKHEKIFEIRNYFKAVADAGVKVGRLEL